MFIDDVNSWFWYSDDHRKMHAN